MCRFAHLDLEARKLLDRLIRGRVWIGECANQPRCGEFDERMLEARHERADVEQRMGYDRNGESHTYVLSLAADPTLTSLSQLDRRRHIEPFIAWTRNRPCRGNNGRGRTVSATQFHHDIVDLRVFFEDIAEWGWASQPSRRLFFLADLPPSRNVPEASR